MESLVITSQNLQTVNWGGDDCFKYCEFLGIAPQGVHVEADFSNCTFKDIDWYWGLFNIVTFVDCRFINCTFRGCSFPGCRFVDCEFDGVRFVRDNLNGACSFEGAVAYGCRVMNSEGFEIETKE
ncbi:MAG: hypothetical protein AMXMBFR82_53220 [Candidatus Hydrogenedentota bacterium]